MSRQMLFYWLLVFALLIAAALHSVQQRHQARHLYYSLQELEKQRDNLQARWSQLTLEKGVVLGQLKTEQLAQRQLKMFYPDWNNIRTIKLNQRHSETAATNTASPSAAPSTEEEAGQ